MPSDSATPLAAPDRPAPGPIAAFAGCCLIWSSTFLVIQIGNGVLPPLWAATLRHGAAAVLLTIIARATGHALPRGAGLRAAALYGLLNFGGSSLLYWGETKVPSGVTAVIFGMIPLITSLTAAAVGLERLRARRVAAAAIGLAGVFVIASAERRMAVPVASLVAVFAAATLAALSGVALKSGPRQNPFAATGAAAGVGCAVCFIASVVARESHAWPTAPTAWASVAYLTLAGSLGAYVMFAYLVNRWPISRVSFIAIVVPVLATVLGAVVHHERVTWLTLSGSALVLCGLLLGMSAERGATP